MIDYAIVDMTGREFVAMFISSHRVEETIFVFTRRTWGALGGLDMNI